MRERTAVIEEICESFGLELKKLMEFELTEIAYRTGIRERLLSLVERAKSVEEFPKEMIASMEKTIRTLDMGLLGGN